MQDSEGVGADEQRQCQHFEEELGRDQSRGGETVQGNANRRQAQTLLS